MASLIVPGSGQLLKHQDRGMVYLAAEAFLLTRFLQLRHDGRRGAVRYRDLAFAVARRGFAPVRRDTVFEYYEQMERYTASGEYNRNPDPAGAVIPEDDPTTYNGFVWATAQHTFFPDPNNPPPPGSALYLDALAFYRAHAVGPDFRWSWRDASLEQEEYRATIRSSDDAFRSSQNQLGLLLANHLASAIDALISSRLSASLRRETNVETTWMGRLPGSRIRVAIAF
ncbi:MAG TPA: hypothetical protein VKO86_03395 [Gemmatimonadales bacterium]|nr:hypothetical protein [Gemmatimonadales bacterium]